MQALALAASKGHLPIVQLLASHGASKEVTTCMGDTPSMLAMDGGHTEVADWLDSMTSSSQGAMSTHAKPKVASATERLA